MKNKYPLLSNVSQMQKALKSGASSSMIGAPMKNMKSAKKPMKMAPAKVQARKKKMISNAASKAMGGLYSK